MSTVVALAGHLARRRPVTGAVRPLALASLFASLILAFLTGAALAVDTAYARRALPGVTIGAISVGSLDEVALRARLTDLSFAWPVGGVEVRDDRRAWQASDASLGLVPDVDAALRAAVGYGKSGPPPIRVAAWLAALSGDARLALPLRSEGDRLGRWVEEIARAVERPAAEGSLSVGSAGLVVSEPQIGWYVDRVELASLVRSTFAAGDRTIRLPLREIHPATDPVRFAEVARAARAALMPLTLRAGASSTTVDFTRSLGILSVAEVPASPRSAPVTDAFVPSTRLLPALRIDEDALAAAAARGAAALDRAPRDASYRLLSNGSLEVVPGVDGLIVDRIALTAALWRGLSDASAPRDVAVSASTVTPPFDTRRAAAEAPALTRVAFFEDYTAPGGSPAPVEAVVSPYAAFADRDAHPDLARAIYAAALAAGLEATGEGAWRNDSGHPILVRAIPTRTSVQAELWGVPSGRRISWAPAGPGLLLRTVREGVATLSQTTVSALLGPRGAVQAP